MGFWNRLRGKASSRATELGYDLPAWMVDGMTVNIYQGSQGLEVVGESNYQDEIAFAVESFGREFPVVLAPEPENDYDPNAVSVWASGLKLGYLSRDDAARYQPAIVKMMREQGQPIGLMAHAVGGEPGRPSYGVWLRHDPEDFGLPARFHVHGDTDTGAGEVGIDDWAGDLPPDTVSRIKKLRAMLDRETDPLQRHFMWLELGRALYKSRDAITGALDDFDAVCVAHDEEMPAIREAMMRAFGGIPRLPPYKQVAIRHQKLHDYETALRWAERGLEMYGEDALRPNAVEDLEKRAAKYRSKLGRH